MTVRAGSGWGCAAVVASRAGGALLQGPLAGVPAALIISSLTPATLPDPLAVRFICFAYPVGAIPAMAPGAVVGALRPRLRDGALAISGALGAMLSLIRTLAADHPGGRSDVAFFAACAAAGGLACARILFGGPSRTID